ncbi:hypothetical protein [Kribbella catacumbae]|uniref:hypothetical protein n=1 Tax=Kribbella catacumbae TaxID=460086 RepID=UPI0003754550|nr:hypothetical protein [Kribbella catacumbae]
MAALLTDRPLLQLAGDVLAHCDGCTWWVRVDELEGKRCTWCRGVVLGAGG